MNSPRDELDINTQAALIDQEHRLTHCALNLWRHGFGPRDDPRSWAARRAIIWAFFSSGQSVAIGAGMIGVIGVMLAWQANSLLGKQNVLVEKQTFLAEAERRAALIYELTSILDEIDEELDERKPEGNGLSDVVFSDRLSGRVVALSRSLRPYRYLDPESGELTDKSRPLSPERAQLLLSLIGANAALTDLRVKGADFSRADLRGAYLLGAKLPNQRFAFADFSGANLSAADLSSSDLRSARLVGANLSGATINEANLEDADLTGADLRDIKDLWFRENDIKKARNWEKALYDDDESVLKTFGLSPAQNRENCLLHESLKQ